MDVKPMTYDEAVARFGGNLTHLAKACEVTRATAYAWRELGVIPRQWGALIWMLTTPDHVPRGTAKKRRS